MHLDLWKFANSLESILCETACITHCYLFVPSNNKEYKTLPKISPKTYLIWGLFFCHSCQCSGEIRLVSPPGSVQDLSQKHLHAVVLINHIISYLSYQIIKCTTWYVNRLQTLFKLLVPRVSCLFKYVNKTFMKGSWINGKSPPHTFLKESFYISSVCPWI